MADFDIFQKKTHFSPFLDKTRFFGLFRTIQGRKNVKKLTFFYKKFFQISFLQETKYHGHIMITGPLRQEPPPPKKNVSPFFETRLKFLPLQKNYDHSSYTSRAIAKFPNVCLKILSSRDIARDGF